MNRDSNIKKLVTGAQLARSADCPQATFSMLLKAGKLKPDYQAGRFTLWNPDRVSELVSATRKAA